MLTLLLKTCLWCSLNFYKLLSPTLKLHSVGLGYLLAQVGKKGKAVMKGNGQHLGRATSEELVTLLEIYASPRQTGG